MPGKTIITCALTGGGTVPTQSKAIPITADQIVEEGIAAAAAGAAVLHIHVRNPLTGEPSADLDLFAEVMSRLTAATDAVLQPTTGGHGGLTIEERGAVLGLGPEMATFHPGSVDLGLFQVLRQNLPFEDWERDYLENSRDSVFRNTFADMAYIATLMARNEVVPEIEIHGVGQLHNLKELVEQGLLRLPLNLQFVLGALGATSVEPDQLIHLVRTAERVLGTGQFSWSAAGIGYPGAFEVVALALTLGGNVRVGLEDNLWLDRSRRAASNAELVAKACQLVTLLDREPASPAEARARLGLTTPPRFATS